MRIAGGGGRKKVTGVIYYIATLTITIFVVEFNPNFYFMNRKRDL